MKRLILLTVIFLSACGPSQEELQQAEIEQLRIEQEKANRIAAVTCSIISETRNMDGAVRVEKVNDARVEIGGEPFLTGDDEIKESLKFGICEELVLNESYYEKLQAIKDEEREIRELIAAEQEAKAKAEAAKAKAEAAKAKAEAAKAKAEAAKAKAEADAVAKAKIAANKPRIEKYLREAIFTESGLAYQILKEGSGPKPNINSTVEVHYAGRLLDGKEFDSSVKRGVPAQFGVTQVISGWTEVLQLMPEGSKWEVYIPAYMAYGSSGAGDVIGPNQDLLFEIELIQSEVE